jgi:hypothetical protein
VAIDLTRGFDEKLLTAKWGMKRQLLLDHPVPQPRFADKLSCAAWLP